MGMWRLQQNVYDQVFSEETQTASFWRNALQMYTVRQDFYFPTILSQAPIVSQRWQAAHLCHLWQILQGIVDPAQSRTNTHRRKTIRLRNMRWVFIIFYPPNFFVFTKRTIDEKSFVKYINTQMPLFVVIKFFTSKEQTIIRKTRMLHCFPVIIDNSPCTKTMYSLLSRDVTVWSIC